MSGNGHGADAGRALRLGGMALRNGLLIHGPTSWAAAARAADGSIEVASGPKPTLAPGPPRRRSPLLRGPLRLAEAFAVLPLVAAAPAARRGCRFEDPARDRAPSVASVAALEPDPPPRARDAVAREARRRGCSALLPALAALRDRDLAAYHGVEHKAIGAYEQGSCDPADGAEGARALRLQPDRARCSLLSIAGQVLTERLVDEPGPDRPRGGRRSAGVGAAVELFVYAERNPDSPVGRAIHAPGHEIQRLVSTREPTPEQLEVGVAALQRGPTGWSSRLPIRV